MSNGHDTEATVETVAVPPQGQQQITIEAINGRLAELQDLNQLLTARCATMRGQLMEKDAVIANLQQALVAKQEKTKRPGVPREK